MTNHWIDLRNSDCIMIIGSNAAENHPISFKWVNKAIDNGAKLISVDPRFTRTSSKAHLYAPIRSGTDITFIGGMIRYVLDDMQRTRSNYNTTYVAEYTNAALIINDGYEGPDDSSHPGLFVDYTANTNDAPGNLGSYGKTKWKYSNTATPSVESKLINNTWDTWNDLDDKCVLKLLWNHFSRYTPEKVQQVTGCPENTFLDICKTFSATGKEGKAGTIMYAMGTTQHTYGTQNIRAYAILQLLLGNIGVAGGGINALRGTSNVQGSTDMCLLSHILPGYLSMTSHSDRYLDNNADESHSYIHRAKSAKGMVTPNGLTGDWSPSWWWYNDTNPNYKKYMVSLLKAWYGDNATSTNDFGYDYLPKVTGGQNYTHIGLFEAVASGTIKGMLCWGQNPAVGGPDAEGERKALENLDWLVVTDLFETETSNFWKRPGVNPSDIDTEVFLLPAACSYEKQGSISNSGRWAQWRYKVIDPPGKAKSDLAIIDALVIELQRLYAADDSAPHHEAITNLFWDYHSTGAYAQEADPNVVAKEVNGYNWTTKAALTSFTKLAGDGSTCSGNWLYCGMFDANGDNKAKQRNTVDESINQIGLYSKWTWCWPVNRRIIYNRASVDLDGKPWDPEHPVISYGGNHNATNNKCTWVGDVPDGPWSPINLSASGKKTLPFIMHAEGVGHLWGAGRAEGPIPEAYEPWESPLDENLITGVTRDTDGGRGFNNPCCYIGDLNDMNTQGSNSEYPCIGTTYRVSEHWQAGQMTRNIPWLVELQPEMFVELGEELAADKGIKKGDRVKVSTARGQVEAIAVVTKRFKRLTIGSGGAPRQVDHIGIPWHWGYTGLSTGSSGNVLTPHVGDANTTIPEYKTFLCKIEKA